MNRRNPIVILIIIFSLSFPILLNADQSSTSFDMRLKEGIAPNSFDKQQLINTTPEEGFKYFSGNTCPINNHPAIYAGNKKLFVLGYEFFKEFPITESVKAFEAYEELLKSNGYLERD